MLPVVRLLLKAVSADHGVLPIAGLLAVPAGHRQQGPRQQMPPLTAVAAAGPTVPQAAKAAAVLPGS